MPKYKVMLKCNQLRWPFPDAFILFFTGWFNLRLTVKTLNTLNQNGRNFF